MNSSDKKATVMRLLAIAGLAALIILIAWLTVQIVKVAPSAFSSLASLAEGIDQFERTIDEEPNNDPLVIDLDVTQVTSGEQVTLSWNKVENLGTYSFSYECIDGVTVAAIHDDGERTITCATNYNLGDVDTLTLKVTSETGAAIDLPYTLSFIRTGDSEVYRSGTAFIPVVPKVAEVAGDVAGASTTPEVIEEEEPTEEPAPAPQPPQTTVQYTYQIPTSDPNGFVNLQASYLNVGGFVGGVFRAGTLEQNSSGAIQFEVKNIGTKTSDEWSFTITLPDGSTYESGDQAPLKPNERSILTLGFDTDDERSHTFRVEVETDEDIQKNNNRFTRSVTIRN